MQKLLGEIYNKFNMNKELSYWLALTHLPKITIKKKNEIIVKLFEQEKTIIDFFHFDSSQWQNDFGFLPTEVNLIQDAVNELSNYAFLVEDLLEQGYNIIPITSKDYSPALKKNLGKTYAPPIIYTKGNLQILQEQSIAIVGSRAANDLSLDFADKIAHKASQQYKVIVSGFAKGVDKQALDSALNYKGQSIIVLPQGISTFNSGFKTYYKQIIDGDVLVLSTFYPKSPWSVQLAMARNPIIYGLASEIYVAESSETGGTWSGVIDGLKKNRTIYVRKPNPNEKNANGLLISKGGIAVDQNGESIKYEISDEKSLIASEPQINGTETKILELLRQGVYDSKAIITKLNIPWTTQKVTSYLKNNSEVQTLQGNPLKFTLMSINSDSQSKLF